MTQDSVFTRIINREIPAAIVYEDEQVIAFMDAGQVNPGHVLVATRRQVETIVELEEGEAAHLFAVAHRVARAVFFLLRYVSPALILLVMLKGLKVF